MIGPPGDDHSDAAAVIAGLDHHGTAAIGDDTIIFNPEVDIIRKDDPEMTERMLGGGLVHGDGGCQQPAMGVGNIHQVEQALNIAVFAHLAMQGVEHPCGLERDQVFGQGTVNLQQLGVPAFFPGGLEARLA